MKKLKKLLLFTSSLLLMGLFIVFTISTERVENVEKEDDKRSEIIPEEEISSDVNYDTKVLLYYVDEKSGILTKEERTVNAKELVDSPYMYTLKLLINGPNIEGLINPIPKETKVNNVNLKNGTLNIDLSDEFLEGKGTNHIYSIVETMSEFNEVNNIKITINGEEKEGMKDVFVETSHNNS